VLDNATASYSYVITVAAFAEIKLVIVDWQTTGPAYCEPSMLSAFAIVFFLVEVSFINNKEQACRFPFATYIKTS